MHLSVNPERECCVDLVVECQDIQCGDPLMDAVLHSLYTDRDDPSCTRNHTGWWADPSRGSVLSNLSGSTTNETLRLAEDAAREALEWMVEDAIATDVRVTATYRNRCVNLEIEIDGPNQCNFITSASEVDFQWVWNGYITRN